MAQFTVSLLIKILGAVYNDDSLIIMLQVTYFTFRRHRPQKNDTRGETSILDQHTQLSGDACNNTGN